MAKNPWEVSARLSQAKREPCILPSPWSLRQPAPSQPGPAAPSAATRGHCGSSARPGPAAGRSPQAARRGAQDAGRPFLCPGSLEIQEPPRDPGGSDAGQPGEGVTLPSTYDPTPSRASACPHL